MGAVREVSQVRPLAGVLGAGPQLLDAARVELEAYFGPTAQASEPYRFEHTRYYIREMGPDLYRQFLVFDALCPPDELAAWKLASNALERRFGFNAGGGRRVNIDPGYLAPGKLVLASTKDFMHRIYLRDGIFAEVTLRMQQGRFGSWEWTYPDYAAAGAFFDRAYQNYLQAIKISG